MSRSAKRAKPLNDNFISSTPLRSAAKSKIFSPTSKQSASKKKSVFSTIFSPVFKLLSPRVDSPTLLQEIEKADSEMKIDELSSNKEQDTNSTEEQSTPETLAPQPAASLLLAQPAIVHEYVCGIDTANACFLEMAEFLSLLPPPNSSLVPALPPTCTAKPTLVLDLDETLVHCSIEELANYTLKFPVDFNGTNYSVYVRTRPHLQDFLQEMALHFEVVLFTASHQLYADKLASILDPESEFLTHRLFREHCVNVDGNYIKDLGILGRSLARTLIVDNSPHAFAYNTANAVPIISWYDDVADRELLKLKSFLLDIAGRNLHDVRPFLRSIFSLPERTF